MYFFASDTHLEFSPDGKGREREKLFTEWLDEVAPAAEAIFLVGDIFDFWFEYRRVVPKGFVRLLGKLAELTDRGVEIHFFTGNHDIWAFDYLSSECGVMLHGGQDVMELYGKKVFIGHGDVLGKHRFLIRARSRLFRNRLAQRLFGALHPWLGLRLGATWSGISRRSKPLKEEFRGEGERIVQFAREYLAQHPDTDLFVCGHIHCAVSYPLTDKTSIAFLGEWFLDPTYGVLDEKGNFELKTYKRP